MYAAEAGQGEACMVLLERGATKRRQRSDGHISLTLAAAAGKASICAMLLQHGTPHDHEVGR